MTYLLQCLLWGFFVSLLSGCANDQGNGGADNRVCFLKNGCVVADCSYQDDNVEYKVTIQNKGEGTSTAQIVLYSQSELDIYNEKHTTDYQLLPETTYKLSEKTVAFASDEKSKEVKITIYPDKLFDIVREDTESKNYALPLKLNGESVTGDNSIVYAINMSYPLFRLMKNTSVRLLEQENELALKAFTYENKEMVEPTSNKGDVSLDVVVPENAEEWIQTYNKENNTEFMLFPKDACEPGKMVGKAGGRDCTASIKLKRSLPSGEKLAYGNYVLPVQLVGKDNHVALDHGVGVVKITNPNNYDDVGVEYDDGQNIIFHVKIAIDKEGLEMKDNDMEYFRTNLEKQWADINQRFNGLDKKGKLKRNYIFVPDLKDIIVYDFKDKDSHWNVPKDYSDRIEPKKYQCVVVYDFAVQEGEGGGGFGDTDGVGNILVINPGKGNIGKFYDHFAESALGAPSIVHEFGHFRGIVDTYLCRVSKQNNPISNQSFEPEAGNMNNPYPTLDQCAWSDYEISVMNVNGAKKEHYMIYKTMRDYFPDFVELTVTENGEPIEGFSLKFYPMENNVIKKDPARNHESGVSKIKLEAKPLFWNFDWIQYPWTYCNLYLVEAISKKTGNKGYLFMPCYEVHKQGIKDKVEEPIDNYSTFKRTINIQSN